jgi:hypothetical protein
MITGSQFAGVGLYSDPNVYIFGSSNTLPMEDDYIKVATNNIQNTTPYDGIDACSDNNTIAANHLFNATAESAIHLDGQCPLSTLSYTSGISNTARGNLIKLGCVGILGLNLAANTLVSNRYTDVPIHTETGTDSYSCTTAGPKETSASVAAPHLQPVRY